MPANEGQSLSRALPAYFLQLYSPLDLQGQKRHDAVSWVESRSGSPNAPIWRMICKIDGQVRGIGTGPQKHVAKDAAANQALAYLRGQDKIANQEHEDEYGWISCVYSMIARDPTER
ncbi:hypothetical protein DFS33DRAFT_1277755 [Desarmillaria ectypa]|nr:hypothetical protein DFS33DRAFT_1277755 [Desarmillaria ectypa]